MAESGIYHDEVELEDFEYNPEMDNFTYPCPCGDLFIISTDDLLNGEIVATCPSCSLILKVIYDVNEVENIIKSKESMSIKMEKITS